MTTTDLTASPEVLFIGPREVHSQVQPLQRAGYKIVLKRPSQKVLEKSVLEHVWGAILLHSSNPESFLEAFAKKRLASLVLLLSPEWPCKRLLSEDWVCIRQSTEGERLVRDFAGLLGQHPVRPVSSLPAWVSQVLPATRAKGAFSKVLQDVGKGARVVVTKHESPAAVIVSYQEYEALQAQPERALDQMRRRFAGLVAEMQTPAFE